MSDDINKQVDAFVALPRAQRYAQYSKLPTEIKRKARRQVEARRGIAYRADGGEIVFTKETLLKKMAQAQHKKDVEYPKRVENINSKMVEYKQQLLENYGEDAVSGAETMLKDIAQPSK